MNRSLSKSIVRDDSGNVDSEATRAAYDSHLLDVFTKAMTAAEVKLKKDYDDAIATFDTDLRTYVEQRSSWDLLSKEYIDAAFARFQHATAGGAITKPTLISMCAGNMLNDGKISFDRIKLAEEMVAAFIDDNNGTLYKIEKGKAGGVRRINTHPDAAIVA